MCPIAGADLDTHIVQGRMIFIVPQFELSVPFTVRPRQIYQSRLNVIYSHGVERK